MFFTDKMPENCTSCPCADGEYGVCNIDYNVGLSADDRPKECPLREVKHAHWDKTCFLDIYQCSACKSPVKMDMRRYRIYLRRYCPDCGAKMDEET